MPPTHDGKSPGRCSGSAACKPLTEAQLEGGKDPVPGTRKPTLLSVRAAVEQDLGAESSITLESGVIAPPSRCGQETRSIYRGGIAPDSGTKISERTEAFVPTQDKHTSHGGSHLLLPSPDSYKPAAHVGLGFRFDMAVRLREITRFLDRMQRSHGAGHFVRHMSHTPATPRAPPPRTGRTLWRRIPTHGRANELLDRDRPLLECSSDHAPLHGLVGVLHRLSGEAPPAADGRGHEELPSLWPDAQICTLDWGSVHTVACQVAVKNTTATARKIWAGPHQGARGPKGPWAKRAQDAAPARGGRAHGTNGGLHVGPCSQAQSFKGIRVYCRPSSPYSAAALYNTSVLCNPKSPLRPPSRALPLGARTDHTLPRLSAWDHSTVAQRTSRKQYQRRISPRQNRSTQASEGARPVYLLLWELARARGTSPEPPHRPTCPPHSNARAVNIG
ncbi:hypothetical protein PSPO01_11003 [Paraphaeosphaeria sporulosa]